MKSHVTRGYSVSQLEKRKQKNGQIMLEYVVALGIFMTLVAVSATLIYVFRAYGNRVLDIISVS
jgi:hypothetical protein